MEIFKSLQKDEKVTDEQYAKWGKALIKDNRKFFKQENKEGKNVIFRVSVTRKALDNLSEAPIEEILKKFKESGAMDKVGFFKEKRSINFEADQSDVAC